VEPGEEAWHADSKTADFVDEAIGDAGGDEIDETWLKAAEQAIEDGSDIIYDVAADVGQIVDNVKHMSWFVEAVARELRDTHAEENANEAGRAESESIVDDLGDQIEDPEPPHKQADAVQKDVAEARSEVVSPDTVDTDIHQETKSVGEAAKTGKSASLLMLLELQKVADEMFPGIELKNLDPQQQKVVEAELAKRRGGQGLENPAEAPHSASGYHEKHDTCSKCGAAMTDESSLLETTTGVCNKCRGDVSKLRGERFDKSRKNADAVQPDVAEAKSEVASPDTVDKDIKQETESVGEAAKTAEDKEEETPSPLAGVGDAISAVEELAPPLANTDKQAAAGDDFPEAADFDFGEGDLAGIVLTEDDQVGAKTAAQANVGDQLPGNWVRYEYRPQGGNRFNENLDLIQELLGSTLYEWKYSDGWYLIRRVEN
jgi:archaellum component FlaC